MKIKQEKPSVCVICTPFPKWQSTQVLLYQLLQTLKPLTSDIFLITGNFATNMVFNNRIHLMNIKYSGNVHSMLMRITNYVITQLKLSHKLVNVVNKAHIVYFFIGGTTLLLPMLTAKLFSKKTILITTGSVTRVSQQINKDLFFGIGPSIFHYIILVLQSLTYRLSDKIVVYSPSLIHHIGLENYKSKILIAHKHFVDFDKFKIEKPLNERDPIVGYIGRLSIEKGILNFIEAIPKLLEREKDSRFLIVGSRKLQRGIEKHLSKEIFGRAAKFEEWVPHDEIPKYLNELKIMILPSYTEGLPTVMLEAMACGTPVLATPVGGIPDVIKDGETGFIMKNNTPECITENVIRALNHQNLDIIVKNARELVEKEFTYEAAVEGYRKIFGSVL